VSPFLLRWGGPPEPLGTNTIFVLLFFIKDQRLIPVDVFMIVNRQGLILSPREELTDLTFSEVVFMTRLLRPSTLWT
jgi:hypothetical protein